MNGESEDITSVQDATQHSCYRGFDYFNIGDKENAIKRFNQVRLLGNEHHCSYAGFAYYYAFELTELEKSFEMYEKVLELADESEHWWLHTDYAEVLSFCYTVDDSREDCLSRAISHLEIASSLSDAPKINRVFAIVYYQSGDYVKSWGQVHKALDGGVPEDILIGLIKELDKELPDPKGRFWFL